MKLKMDYKWVALSVTTVGMFMASLDSCIVVVGLPTILQDLHASIVHGIWIITGYMFLNFLALFNMPNWIKNIGFGIAFLISPILDGITTNIALTKYRGKEANPVTACVIKKIGIRFRQLFFSLLPLLTEEKNTYSSF
jgi:MFS family permease